MLYQVIRNGFTIDAVVQLAAIVFVVFCVVPLHEISHALAADLLGDETPRLKGRLTVNPMAHVDWMGALLLLFVGFGWGKPVTVNMRNFKMKNKKLGMAIVAFAGPVSNIIMAFVTLLIMFVAIKISGIGVMENGSLMFYKSAEGTLAFNLVQFLYFAASVNTSLAVFNLIPIPPLDGSRLVSVIIPNKYYYKIMQYERYIIIAIMILTFTRVLSIPISFLSDKLLSFITFIASFPLKF